jgi:hypothetical protein
MKTTEDGEPECLALRRRLTDLIRETIPADARFDPVICTGGNCMAMCVVHGERWMEITDGDSEVPFTDDDFRDLVFSYFSADGTSDGGSFLLSWPGVADAEYWDVVIAIVRAWVSGQAWLDADRPGAWPW